MAQMKTFGVIADAYEVDILSHPIIAREGVVLVHPKYQADFLKTLEHQNIQYSIHAADVKAALDMDDVLIEARRNTTRARNGRELPYDNYQTLDVIYAYLDDIAAIYPNLVTLVTPANSFEGRPMKYLKISTTNFQDTRKPIIFIDGGMHPREWISPPTVTWGIKKLVEKVTDPDLLQKFDWILLPMVNPDGYVHTFSTRFWRKTRSTNSHSLSNLCPGVDGNRNYDFYWNTVGTSSDTCAETYAGNRAFSEVETQVVRDILQEHLQRIALYLTMHSHGSMILYPWGHDGSLSKNALALHTVGIAMVAAIHAKALSNFPRYVVGNAVHVIGYGASGVADNYAHCLGVLPLVSSHLLIHMSCLVYQKNYRDST